MKMKRKSKLPSIKDVANDLSLINRESVDNDSDEEAYGIDVRLQVTSDGSWFIHFGDASYDTDHRGYWGDSSVPGNGERFDAKAVARDLVDQVKEQMAASGTSDEFGSLGHLIRSCNKMQSNHAYLACLAGKRR
jgi:hypothetical protein